MGLTSHGLFTATSATSVHAKGGCYVYGTPDRGVDFGVFIVGEGTLFLGKTAIKEAAELLGFRFDEEGRDLEISNAELERENQRLKAYVADLTRDLAVIGAAINRATA